MNQLDAEHYQTRLRAFVTAARALADSWHEVGDRGYPPYLPSFDEFVRDLQVWESQASLVGRLVQFIRPVDRFPHVLVQTGETGKVVTADDETIAVILDRYVPELVEWENCVLFTKYMDTYDEFGEACSILP